MLLPAPLAPRMGWWRRPAVWVGAALFLVALFAVLLVRTAISPVRPDSRHAVIYRVPAGTSAASIGVGLQRAGVIRSALAFRLWSQWLGLASHLKAGEYRLSPAMSLRAVLRVLEQGRILETRVSIPEGFTVAQIVDRLVALHVASRSALERALAAGLPGLVPPKGVKVAAEGFLFPDTYIIPRGTPPRQVILAMWDDFLARTASLRQALPAHRLTLWQWVTLASIVQAEDGRPQEAPRIAAVFLNRLKADMPLQSDATVRYAMGRPVAHLNAWNLAWPSPYNTYRHSGLPPGPIDSPGLVALYAVIHPAPVPYLFFVAAPDGQVLFATTYAQHLANIARVHAMEKH
jgi:UPF0755 protein